MKYIHWIILGVALLLSSIVFVNVDNELKTSEISARKTSNQNIHKDAMRMVSNSVHTFGAIVSGMRAYVSHSDSLPTGDQLQSFLNSQLDGIGFRDPVVVSYIDTSHSFIYSFNQQEMNPDNLVGQKVNTFRDDHEIRDLNNLMTNDDIMMFEPINLVEGWVGIPINFRVHFKGKTLGYIASLVMFKSIVQDLYDSALPNQFAFRFKINGVEFDREVVHDGTDVYNDSRDTSYYKQLSIDTSIYAQTKMEIFGQVFEITTWPKSSSVWISNDRIMLSSWFLTFILFSFAVTWLFDRQRKYLVLIKKSNDQLKSSKKQIQDQNIRMLKLNATRERFFSIIAHDLRSPLASIKGLMDGAMKDKIQNPEVRELFFNLRETTSSTLALLDNLLRWAIAQTGDIPFKPFPLNIYNVVADAVNVLSQSAREKEISISYEIDESIFCVGDKNMLTTIFRNLISNSLKFTPKGGKINISAVVEDDVIKISVVDTGKGMEPDQISNLFDFSARISDTTNRKQSGTGLGLILCKDFIDKHNGTIEVESKVGIGSTFIVCIPAFNRSDS